MQARARARSMRKGTMHAALGHLASAMAVERRATRTRHGAHHLNMVSEDGVQDVVGSNSNPEIS